LKSVLVNQVPMEVENTWMHGQHLIFKFKGVDTISDAERLAGAEVCIPTEQRVDAPDGEYYQSDLVGCEVVDEKAGLVGVVDGWQETGGPPLIEVKTKDGKELLIPFAKAICLKIDVQQRRIDVRLPEGLLELNQ
jgi:16S rRNA processing protein RimM